MKRLLLASVFIVCTRMLHAQLEEDFTPAPANWLLSNGFSIHAINGNDAIVSPNKGGSTQAVIGTPVVFKTSNTVEICFDIFAYSANLQDEVAFPCATYVNLYFVQSSVTNGNQIDSSTTFGSVTNVQVPANGGTLCHTFNFPANIPDSNFRMFVTIHADCADNVRYVLDNFVISGMGETCDDCPPVALSDVFNRTNPSEFSFLAVLYGANITYPAPPPGYAVDTTGTDHDPNDTYTHVRWSLVTPPSNGTATVNPDGTASISRSDLNITQLTFTYQMCDDGADNNFATTDDNLCDTATVTVNYPAGAPLPISLVNFNASRNGLNVVLTWTTAAESNNAGFEIQRGTGDGNYTTVGYVASKANNGNSAGTLQYQFNEMNNSNALTWYRIVQFDNNGMQKIFPARAVRGLEELKKMLIYPNPGKYNNLNVLFGSAGIRDIMITDLNGKLIKRWNNYRDDNLSVYGLQPGLYMLKVINRATRKQFIEKILITN